MRGVPCAPCKTPRCTDRLEIGYHRAMHKTSWRTPLVVLICGSAILMICFGVRQNYGLLMGPISADMHWGREVFALAIAWQNLVWGITTPIAGFIADRYGPARVAAIGSLLYATGLILMSQASTPMDATLSIGVLTGLSAFDGGVSGGAVGDRPLGRAGASLALARHRFGRRLVGSGRPGARRPDPDRHVRLAGRHHRARRARCAYRSACRRPRRR